MPASVPSASGKHVFLNIPFDAGYERLFVALIATVVMARLIPRCAIELPERGEGQLERIRRLMGECPLSLHDLSRSGRFNMPFELGLAVELSHRQPHEYVLLEAERGRLARRLSDLHIQPLIHGNGPHTLMGVLCENLGGAHPSDVVAVYRRLIRAVPDLKREYLAADVFRKNIFEELVSGATELAAERGVFGSARG